MLHYCCPDVQNDQKILISVNVVRQFENLISNAKLIVGKFI